MNKILALDPLAIESYIDWLKFQPYVGQNKGLFMANFPRHWVSEFIKNELDTKDWGFYDTIKIKEFLISQESNNTFVSLNSTYDKKIKWGKNYNNVPNANKIDCIPIASRSDNNGLRTFEDLQPEEELFIDSTKSEGLTPNGLLQCCKLFFQNSSKIAFVDRHNYLLTAGGELSTFTSFIQGLLKIIKDPKKCHAILIYSKYDPEKYPYMKSNDALYQQLSKVFGGHTTPTYGIKYMCCQESSKNEDLHARKIVTNHVVFNLQDSISGHTRSQSITRVADKNFREKNIKSWIDEDHGLDVISSATYIDLVQY